MVKNSRVACLLCDDRLTINDWTVHLLSDTSCWIPKKADLTAYMYINL